MLVIRCFACLCLIIVQLVEFVPVLAGLDPRPEIHVTLHLKESDGELTLDVPSVVPKAWVESAQEMLAGALGSDVPDRQLGTQFSERDGKEFIRLKLEFESIAAMRMRLPVSSCPVSWVTSRFLASLIRSTSRLSSRPWRRIMNCKQRSVEKAPRFGDHCFAFTIMLNCQEPSSSTMGWTQGRICLLGSCRRIGSW